MNSFRIEKDGQPIHSVDEWRRLAPPKKKDGHWKDGRSAKEQAKAWFPPDTESPRIPEELDRLIRSRAYFEQLEYIVGIPEHIVRLDDFKGEQRNQDLMLIGQTPEAKREQAQHAIFVVHEFVELTDGKPDDQEALDRNRDDYARFVRLLLKDPGADIKPDTLYGPTKVPGGEFIPGDISLFIGKTRRYLEPETGVICSKTQ